MEMYRMELEKGGVHRGRFHHVFVSVCVYVSVTGILFIYFVKL